MEQPTVLGIEKLDDSGVTIRCIVKTPAFKQADVLREWRRRLKDEFDRAGIDFPDKGTQEVKIRSGPKRRQGPVGAVYDRADPAKSAVIDRAYRPKKIAAPKAPLFLLCLQQPTGRAGSFFSAMNCIHAVRIVILIHPLLCQFGFSLGGNRTADSSRERELFNRLVLMFLQFVDRAGRMRFQIVDRGLIRFCGDAHRSLL